MDESSTKKIGIRGIRLMKCGICGKDDISFFKVDHKARGGLKICRICFEKERLNLNPLRSSGCACCR